MIKDKKKRPGASNPIISSSSYQASSPTFSHYCAQNYSHAAVLILPCVAGDG